MVDTEMMDVGNGKGWTFATKIVTILVSVLAIPITGALIWLGSMDARVARNTADLANTVDTAGHVLALQNQVNRLDQTIQRLDARLQRQWDHFNNKDGK